MTRIVSKYLFTFKACTEISALLLKNMDHNADPCHDFFQYACGNWVNRNALPKGVHIKSVFRDLMIKSLEEWSANLLDTTKQYKGPILLARTVLQACLKANATQNVRQPLLKFMESHGGMPLIHDPDGKKVYNSTNPKDMASLLAANDHLTFLSLAQRGPISPFFTVTTKKAYNASSTTLAIRSPSLLLVKRIYRQNAVYWSELPQIMLNAIQHMSGNVEPTMAQKIDAESLKVFASEILSAIQKPGSRTVETKPLKDLKQMFPQLDWNDYLGSILPEHMRLTDNYADDIEFETTTKEWADLARISLIIDQHVQSGKCRVVLNYIWFSTMHTLFEKLAMDRDIYKVFTGNEYPPPAQSNQEVCSDMLLKGHLDQAVGALYVQEHLNNTNVKNDMNDMVANIKAEMMEILQKANWLDTQTKVEALAKIKAMKEFLVYPDMAERWNNGLLDQYYANLSFISQSSYFDLIQLVNSWALKKHFQILVDSSMEKEWISSPAMMNAMYYAPANSITINAGILVPPVFYKNGPQAMNYGGIGSVVGHEITHGFDNRGSLFDEDGDHRDWWQTESKMRFRNKSKCFVYQYGSLETGYANITLDGRKTLGENMADEGGIKLAYRAYRKYIKKLGKEEPRLPGLMHLTNNQLFFISTAQAWCGTFTKEGLQEKINDDPHAIQKFRVGMQTSNSKHFHQAFQCKEGTKHNPDEQCRIWLR